MRAIRTTRAPRATAAPRPVAAVLFATALAALLASLPAAADPHPNAAGGVDVAQAFQLGDLDNINLFNGALTVTFPLGISYPVNSTLSYRFTLVANSNPWDFQFDGGDNLNYSQPSHCSNAGLGWRVSLGALGFPFSVNFPVCVPTDGQPGGASATYEAPDGSQHFFYQTLHRDDPPPVPNVAYTRDGTYLRLQTYPSYYEIEFPDGMIHRFDLNGRIIQMRDRFVSSVNIAYPALAGCTGAFSGETSCWQITDYQGRTQWIYFRSDLPPYTGVAPYGSLISRVVLSGFNGSLETYQFNYQQQIVERGFPNGDPNKYGPVSVPLLSSVAQPDGSSLTPGGYLMIAPPAYGSASLTSLILPTLGRLDWTYQQYQFPTGSTGRSRLTQTPGIQSRKTSDEHGNLIGLWTYATVLGSPITSIQLVNTVTDPLSNQHVRYFSVSTANARGPGSNAYDYGRQYTPNTPYGSNNLYLSEQLIDSGGVVRRTDYLRYERDQAGPLAIPDSYNNNGREAQRETIYDDGTHSRFTDQLFDGLGHYRLRATDGTFPGNNQRQETHQFNPTHGTYTIDQTSDNQTGNYMPWLPTVPWVLGTQTFSWMAENGISELRSFCYDPNTGFLKRMRRYVQGTQDPAAMSSTDALLVTTPDANGNLGSEQSFGGDNSPVAPTSSDLCSQSLPPTAEYQINRAYTYGINSVTQYVGTGFYSLYLGVDRSTGLPTFSRDTANIQTNFTYGPMGRPAYVQPRDGAWTQYLFHPASSPSSLASLTVDRQQNGSPGTSLAQTKYFYDALGRPIEQDIRMPDGSFSAKTTRYNALNWKTEVSEQGSPTNGLHPHLTLYQSYDAFGRVGTLRPPDSTGGHDVKMAYTGMRTVATTVSIGKTWTGSSVSEAASTTTRNYDRFGRLASVTEPSGSGGASVTTAYQYDAGNRLTLASTSSAGITQNRVFTYDHRGFLSWEAHPETAPNSLGLGHHKDYTSYDSRGHFHRTVEGINDLSYTYDAAERPKLVYNTQFGGNCSPSPVTTPTCVEQFSYDLIAAGALGKLYQATRYNHILFNGGPDTSAMTYTNTYFGLDGRLSQLDLQHTFNGSTTSGQESFTQSWTYTQLGRVDTETYPHCAPGFIYCTGTTTRAVQNLYSPSSGFLTAVNGYTGAAGITYYANGMVATVAHPSGLTATYGADPFGMPRPSSIASGGWASGAYVYDGAGNVDQIGHGYYTYDPVSRLTTAQVETSEFDNPSPAFNLQTTTYDAFGNIQGFPTNNMTPTDPATNHLTGATYDSSGNIRSWNGPPPAFQVPTYDYDELNQLKHYKSGAQEWFYMYGPGGERIWSFQPATNGLSRFDRWTLRGLDEKVRRTFELYGDSWSSWGGSDLWEDHIYRDGTLLGAYLSTGQQHQIDVDHLGTPRLITTTAGGQFAYHVYLPYGVEAVPASDFDRMKFTGHERDLADLSSTAATTCTPATPTRRRGGF